MLSIRASQLAIFEALAVRKFEDRMIVHLKAFAPSHSRILTEDELRVVIRSGMATGETFGFTSERSLKIYTELMLMLGSSFATDPLLPWAPELLREATGADELERINRLRDRAWEHVDQVLPDFRTPQDEDGPRSFIEQIRQLRQERNEPLSAASTRVFQSRVIAMLKHTLPRKAELLGDQGLHELIERAVERARTYEITTERGCALFGAAMFLLGSGFDTDPQLPWIARTLNDASIPDQTQRVDRLFAGAIECLKRLRPPPAADD